MIKRGSLILISLVVISSVTLLIKTAPTVQAASAFSVGDEFLYQIDILKWINNNETLLVYDDYDSSLWSKYQAFDYYLKLQSIVVFNVTENDEVMANVSTNEYSKGDMQFHWGYKYNGTDWYLDDQWGYDNTHAPDYLSSDYVEDKIYFPIQNTNITADFVGSQANLNGINYISDTQWNGSINGNSQTIEVNIYAGYETQTSTYESPLYDFYLNITKTEEWEITYYVDPTHGTILECFCRYIVTKEASITTFSQEFNSTVYYSMYDVTTEEETWKLKETTIDYNAVDDASLPGLYSMLPYNDTISDNNSLLCYTFEIKDPSNLIDVELYIDDYLVSSWSALSAGVHNVTVNTNMIPYYGPLDSRRVAFIFYDNANHNHNTTWIGTISDQRIKTPQWPCWIEGPTNLTFYTADQQFYVIYTIYADTNWTLYGYQVVGNQSFSIFYAKGYLNSTVSLSNSTSYPGTYYYYLELVDSAGNRYRLNITIIIIEGSDIFPSIYGPSEIDYYIGDYQELYYELYDDDPTVFELFLNDLMILNGTYYDGMTISINLQDYIFEAGTHNFTMVAYDASGHMSSYTTYVYAFEDTVAPYISPDTTEIHMLEGEDKNIVARISDAHPGYIELYKNGQLIKTYDDWRNEDYTLYYSLKDLGPGTWEFEIKAIDAFGNNASVIVTVYVTQSTGTGTETSTEPTTTSGGTISVDAPGALIAIVALISLVGVVSKLKNKI